MLFFSYIYSVDVVINANWEGSTSPVLTWKFELIEALLLAVEANIGEIVGKAFAKQAEECIGLYPPSLSGQSN